MFTIQTCIFRIPHLDNSHFLENRKCKVFKTENIYGMLAKLNAVASLFSMYSV